jgi:hypothetical protein
MEEPRHAVCPVCRHAPAVHGESGRCAREGCACSVDPLIFRETEAAARARRRELDAHLLDPVLYASIALLALSSAGLALSGWFPWRPRAIAWLHAITRTSLALGALVWILARLRGPQTARRLDRATAVRALIIALGVAAAVAAWSGRAGR